MKRKRHLLLFILLLSTYLYNQTYARQVSPHINEAFTLKVEKFSEFSAQGTGNGSIRPEAGNKFVSATVELTNITNSKQEVILADVFLADTLNKRKYELNFVMKATVVAIGQKKYHTVKPGDSIRRMLVYSVPKELSNYCALFNNQFHYVQQ